MGVQAKDVQIKDPDARLDYTWDWTDWLIGADTISTVTLAYIPNDASLTIETPVIAGGTAIVMISGGNLGKTYAVTAHLVTSEGREDDRTRLIRICER